MTDADDLEQLKLARTDAITRYREMLSKPRPSYSVDGQQFSHTDYQRFLMSAIKGLDQLIVAREPFFEVTQLFS